MRVLVTGGAGFIGSHFAKRLKRAGEDVIVLDKLTYSGNPANLEGSGVELVVGDICEPETVARAAEGCQAIVNFAAETHVDRSILGATDFGRTEFTGTQVLLELVRRTGARYVQVSTDEVYGDFERGGSASESDPIRPSSPYSVAKAAGDLHIPAYVRTFGVEACVTRGANTYGPNQYPEKLIPLFVTNALDGEPLPLYGDGRQVRDWLHVDDHCAGIELVLRSGKAGEIYNLGAGNETENIRIATRILELTGADPELLKRVQDRPGHDRRYSLDCGKIAALGWAPEVELETGLGETVDWYRSNRGWWEPIKSGAHYRDYYARQYGDRLSSAG
jgi:dTDP-glucose 4,6-dehydratase